MELKNFILIGAGGAIGSMLRYAFALIIGARSFPYSTFAVNIIGCLMIGILFGLGWKHNLSSYGWKFFATGVCGGFTTFSAFSLEGVEFLQQSRYTAFTVYILLSVLLGIAFTFAGYALVKSV